MKASQSVATALLVGLLVGGYAMAMPPLKGAFEPHYPPGVNTPDRHLLQRDEPNLEGTWNCLIILIDFPDYTWDNQNDSNFSNQDLFYTSDHYNEMLFSEGGFRHPGAVSDYTGSMRDYYREVSSGLFETVGVATRWYRAPQPYSYYCNNDAQDGTDDDYGFGDYPHNVQKLVEDAIGLADQDVDFSDYDNDHDELVDALFVVHAGPGAEELPEGRGVGYIWSHSWQLLDWISLDGVFIAPYTMEPENGTIGVFCHEFGHAIGLPDLYDIDDTSEGVGEWCLMGGGGWCYRPGDPYGSCPVHMCGWAKARLEWVRVVNIAEPMRELTIMPVTQDPTVYRLWTRGEREQEYFLLENRRRIGFDAGLVRRQVEYDLPAPEGLLITHIDDNQWSNREDAHRLVDVEEASPVLVGNAWREHLDGPRVRPNDLNLYNPNRGDDGDLWPGFAEISRDSTRWQGARSRDRFGVVTVPSSVGYDGNPSLVEVSNITLDGPNITCDITPEAPNQPELVIGRLEVTDGESDIIQPGEVAFLNVYLRNLGRRAAELINLTLAYEGDLNVSIDPAEGVEYSDLPPGAEAAGRSLFAVSIPNDAPAPGAIRLSGHAICNEGLDFPVEVVIVLRPPHDWVKAPHNPVLVGTPGRWDAGGIWSFDGLDYDDTLRAWYIGNDANGTFGGIGLAWSLNHGRTWVKRAEPVNLQLNQQWAAGGAGGIGVFRDRDNLVMMLIVVDAGDSAVIARAASQDGVNWEVDDEPAITASGWAEAIFPAGQLDIIDDGAQYICGYAASQGQQYVSLGAARSDDLIHWQPDDQAWVSPTFDMDDFDAYACASPDISTWEDGMKLFYCGLGRDFLARMGEMAILDSFQFERRPGLETGGAILEADNEGWEAEGMVIGGRLIPAPEGRRLLYTMLTGQTAAVGLAFGVGPLASPIEPTAPATLPRTVLLDAAYPNPFNGQTVIPYRLAKAGEVTLSVYDPMGRVVIRAPQGRQSAGRHIFVWNAPAGGVTLPSGFYIVRVETPFGSAGGTMVMLK